MSTDPQDTSMNDSDDEKKRRRRRRARRRNQDGASSHENAAATQDLNAVEAQLGDELDKPKDNSPFNDSSPFIETTTIPESDSQHQVSFSDYELPSPGSYEPQIPKSQSVPVVQSTPPQKVESTVPHEFESVPSPQPEPQPQTQPEQHSEWRPPPQPEPEPQREWRPEPQSQVESRTQLQSESVNEAPTEVEAEVVDRQPVSDSDSSPEEMEPSFSERFNHFLHEANLSPRHLKFCCGGLIGLVLFMVVVIVLIPRLWGFFTANVPVEPEVETPVESPAPEPEPEPEKPVPSGNVWVEPSIYSAILLGEFNLESLPNRGLQVAFLEGESEQSDPVGSKFQTYVRDLEVIYNYYNVELEPLLNASNSRTATLDEHVEEFKAAYNSGVAHYESIQNIRLALTAQFDSNEAIKEATEQQFFEEVNEFEGASAEQNLIYFIELAQGQADLKAKYLAFGKLEEMYLIVLENSLLRIKDIQLNREALIAGIQVVDVYGSDLDLILTESDLDS